MSQEIKDTNILKNKTLQQNITKQFKEHKIDQLDDIENVDRSNFFPLAPGWWALIYLIALLITIKIIRYIRVLIYRTTYRWAVFSQLDKMALGLNDSNANETLRDLAKIIRRLKMFEHSRSECCNLTGKKWLSWLKNHDKYKFDWEKYGEILISSAYACPEEEKIDLKSITRLLDATKKWVAQ